MALIQHNRRYNAPKDHIGNSLIKDTLLLSKKYRRNTAWFRLSALKVWAPVLKDITTRDIKIEILASLVGGPNSELVSMLEGLASEDQRRQKLLEFGNEVVLACAGMNIDPSQHSFRHKILQYLLASEKLEIRFAISKPFLQDEELFHKKEGYFILEDNETIYFEGSFNESEGGLTRQGEHATVWSSYNDADQDDIDLFVNEMDAEWNGADEYTEVIKVSPDTINRIKSHVARDPSLTKKIPVVPEGKSIDDVPGENLGKPEKVNYAFIPTHYKGKEFELQKHQTRANNRWEEAGGKGILAHATGSGKTITALYSLSKVAIKNQRTIALIHVPYQPLADQWVDELSYFNLNPIQCYRSRNIWENELNQKLSIFNQSGSGYVLPLVVVDRTFNSKVFQKILEKIPQEKMIYICDECHRFAKKGRTSKLPTSQFRLGLSGTPFNSENEDSLGDIELKRYFGDPIDTFSIKDALDNKVLTPYEYKLVECSLSEDEMDKIKFQQKIQARNRNDEKDEPNLAFNIASGKINRIMGQAEDKFIKLNKLLKDEKIEPTIFFSGDGSTELDDQYLDDSDRQIMLKDVERIGKLINEHRWKWRKFTYEQNHRQKKENLESFISGDTDALVSVRVLDEGIDIPGIKKAFILASTSNKRQYVQRRGRVLRKAENKTKAVIYDFICMPPYENPIAKKEIKRALEMGRDAINKDEVLEYVTKKASEFNIDLDSINEF